VLHAGIKEWGNLRLAWQDLAALGGFFALTCLYAHRVLINFTVQIAGTGRDVWQTLWNMWWFKEALDKGQNPYFTDMLHYPSGITLLFQTMCPFNCALALPFDAILGQPAAYNAVFLFSFVATGFFMYLLAHELLRDRLAAFASGCALTFSLFHFAHAQGHLQLTAIEWVPLFVLFLIRVWRYRRLSDGVLLGMTAALITFCDIYYLASALLIACLSVLVQACRSLRELSDKRLISAVGLGAVVFLSTGGILIISMLVKYLTTNILPAHDSALWSADLQAFFIPPWISAYGDRFRTISQRCTGSNLECCQYIGYSVFALWLTSVALRPKGGRPWAWVGLGILGIILSLGPWLHWGGQIFPNVRLPFWLVEKAFPFFKMSGLPIRWYFLTVFASAVLVGMGVAILRSWYIRIRFLGLSLGTVIGSLVLIVMLIELAPRWVETRPMEQPMFIKALREETGTFAVYDLGRPAEALLRQMGHGRPLIGGYISRGTREARDFLRNTPVLRALRGEQKLSSYDIKLEANQLGLRFVIVPVEHSAAVHMVENGLKLRWQEGLLEVWEVPRP
jgi:hypothetical protein